MFYVLFISALTFLSQYPENSSIAILKTNSLRTIYVSQHSCYPISKYKDYIIVSTLEIESIWQDIW